NSIEWIAATIACWKLGAVPQPLSARLPEAELEGLLELRPSALVVGRADPRGKSPSVPTGFTPDPGLSNAPLPEVVSPAWKAIASGGSTGRPKLIEAAPTDQGLVLRDIWLLRLRALLARAQGDEAA